MVHSFLYPAIQHDQFLVALWDEVLFYAKPLHSIPALNPETSAQMIAWELVFQEPFVEFSLAETPASSFPDSIVYKHR